MRYENTKGRQRRSWRKRGGAWLVLLILTCRLLGQNWPLPHEHYSVNDGLSDRMVNAIVQTDDGLLWLGTENGLNRFDGYEFLVFNAHPDSELKISKSNIQKLFIEQNGRIVIIYNSTVGSFDLLDPRSMEVHTVRLLPEFGIEGLPRLITVNNQGEILIVTFSKEHTRIYRYHQEHRFEELARIPEQRQGKIATVHLIQLSPRRFLLNDSEKGLRIYDAATETLQFFERADFECLEMSASYPGTAYFMHQSRDGKVWLSLQGQAGVYQYQPRQGDFQLVDVLPEQSYYTKIWEDQVGNVLLSSSHAPRTAYPLKGLYCIASDGLMLDLSSFLELSPYIVHAAAKNFFETIFLGVDRGLTIVQNQQSKIVKYLAKHQNHDLRGVSMRGMVSDGRRYIYIAREVEHIYQLDLQTGQLDTLRLIDEHSGRAPEITAARNLQLDGQGNLWGVFRAGTASQSGRLLRYNIQDCQLKIYNFDYKINAFTFGADGRLWLCTEPFDAGGGLLVSFDPASERFEPFFEREGRNPLQNAPPHFILEAVNGLLWIGTDNGLYQIDRDNQAAKSYRATLGGNSLSSDVIYAIHEAPDGRLLLGTTNGLVIMTPERGEFEHYDRDKGLASNTVCGIVPDEHGNFWISTYNGLSYFDIQNKRFRNFYAIDGLSHDEFNRFSYLRGPDGRFYFGGVNGLNVFKSEDLLVQAEAPPLVLTKVLRYNARKNQTSVQYANLSNLDQLVIGASDSYFTVQFTLPRYINIRRNFYQTFLEGYDKGWSSASNAPNLRLNKLPPGKYNLRVKAVDANGNEAAANLQIPILIQPAFHQTILFRLLVLLLIIGLASLWFRYRLERSLEVERVRIKLSSDLHDNVSGSLAGIAAQADILQTKKLDEDARKRLQTISQTSRKVMGQMSDVIWSIDSRKDRVEDLLNRMKMHADEVLTPLDIVLEMHVSSKLDRQKNMPVELRQNLYFIFKEAINNIAKHSDATRATVKLFNEGHDFVLMIQDNGKNAQIPPTSNGNSGQGLDNLRLRAQRINAQLDIVAHDNGFKVTLRGKRFC
jgi:signal transduction histidine kinase/ligand-binding sensor domain-containing protein